jgi:hypothetical protein
VLAVPAAIGLARQTAQLDLIDAAWGIPVAAGCAVSALLFVRGARGRIRATLERAGGAGRIRAAVVLSVLGLCLASSAAISVGFYELLLRLEG